MIKGMIDVSKIDKKRLYTGKKGAYLNFVFIETPESEYGDYMIVEDVSYDERLAGKRGTILGNARIVSKTGGVKHEDAPQGNTDEETDLPF